MEMVADLNKLAAQALLRNPSRALKHLVLKSLEPLHHKKQMELKLQLLPRIAGLTLPAPAL